MILNSSSFVSVLDHPSLRTGIPGIRAINGKPKLSVADFGFVPEIASRKYQSNKIFECEGQKRRVMPLTWIRLSYFCLDCGSLPSTRGKTAFAYLLRASRFEVSRFEFFFFLVLSPDVLRAREPRWPRPSTVVQNSIKKKDLSKRSLYVDILAPPRIFTFSSCALAI